MQKALFSKAGLITIEGKCWLRFDCRGKLCSKVAIYTHIDMGKLAEIS